MVSGFSSVKVMVELAPVWILDGLNALLMVGGATTTRDAVLEVGPAGSSAVLTPLVVLVCVPALLLVTLKVMVHPAAGMLIPVKPRLVCPTVSDAGVTPVHVPPIAVAPTDIPVRVSVKEPAVCATPEGLVRVSVTVEVPPLRIVAGAMALEIPMVPTPSRAVFEGLPAATVSFVVTPDALLV